jgi:hypothetical protein
LNQPILFNYQLAFFIPLNLLSSARSLKRFLARLNSEITERPHPLSVHLRLTLVSAVTAGSSVNLNCASIRVFNGNSGLWVMNFKAFLNGSLFEIVTLRNRSVNVWQRILQAKLTAPWFFLVYDYFDYNRFREFIRFPECVSIKAFKK